MPISKINILNQIFTRNMLRHFIEGKSDSNYTSVIKRYVYDYEAKKNVEIISEIYSELKRNYRNEYFYKNTLLNKLLLGVHSLNTTTALTEIPIARSKADFVMINGKAVVYEIKTELDNLERLGSQLDDYYKAFDHVAVITYENNVSQVEKQIEAFHRPIGIYVLRKNGSIGTVKEPGKYTADLDKETIFKLLRKGEYEEILLGSYGCLPNVTQFRYYDACKELFFEVPMDDLYPLVLKQLKKRVKIEKEEFVRIPYELRFLAYFMDLKLNEYQELEGFLDQQYGGV